MASSYIFIASRNAAGTPEGVQDLAVQADIQDDLGSSQQRFREFGVLGLRTAQFMWGPF